jgi:hypothetical protein
VKTQFPLSEAIKGEAEELVKNIPAFKGKDSSLPKPRFSSMSFYTPMNSITLLNPKIEDDVVTVFKCPSKGPSVTYSQQNHDIMMKLVRHLLDILSYLRTGLSRACGSPSGSLSMRWK